MSNVGSATLDFGAASSKNTDASVNVTGQGTILANSQAEAWFMGSTTSDHSADEHIMASSMIRLVCGTPSAGVGFTITGIVDGGSMTGAFTVQWVWS